MSEIDVKTPIPDGPDRAHYLHLIDYVRTHHCGEHELINVLHVAQQCFGYIPQPAMLLIGELLDVPASQVYGVVTFYSFFTEKPKGKYAVSLCLGTACYVKGAQQVLQKLEQELHIKADDTTEDRLFSINPSRCLGDCSNAPVMMINEDVYHKVTPDMIPDILQHYRDLEAGA